MKTITKIVITVVVFVSLVLIVIRLTRPRSNIGGTAGITRETAPGPVLEIFIITAVAVEPWFNAMAQKYNSERHLAENRPVSIEVVPMDGLAAFNKWEWGNFDPFPTAWLAESRVWIDQANLGAAKRTGRDIFLSGGRYRAQPVVLSPIVWGIWKEAHQVLNAYFNRNDISWDELHEAAAIGEWTGLGGKPEWGCFKLVIAHPSRDPAGLSAMVGAAGEYYDKPALITEQFADPLFLDWLSGLLNTVVDFSPFGVENMLLFGRSNGDAGQIVESYLLSNMEGILNRWKQSLVILYPDPIVWFDFPYAVYMGKETSALKKKAALDFRQFILSPPQQRAALNFGLRPANPNVSNSGGLVKRWEQNGVKVNIPSSSRMRYASRNGLDALARWYSAKYEE